jgi:hypothetical protein
MRWKSLGLIALLGCVFLDALTPATASCTLPFTLTNGQTADATQVMANYNAIISCLNTAAPAGSTNAVQYNAGSGSFGGVGPLTNGQLLIGSTGGPPQATTLTAGTGIGITNGPGSITITAGGSGGSNGSDAPFTAPVLSSMTWMQQGGASAVQDGNYVHIYNPASNNANTALVLPIAQTSFTITARIRPSLIAVNFQVQAIVLASSAMTAGKLQMHSAIYTGGLANEWSYWDSGWSFDHASHVNITYADAIWLRVVSTPTANTFYISQNGRVWTQTNSDTNSWIGAPIAYAGIMCGPEGSGYDANITIDSLQVTYP